MEKSFQKILGLFPEFQVRTLSQKFLEKFWLKDKEFTNDWEAVKEIVFSKSFKRLPDVLFNEGFEMIAQRGGTLFIKDEYLLLQECMKAAKDKFFVVVENRFIRKKADNDLPYLQFKFPVYTTWEELNNGDENYPDIAYDLLWIMNKDFFVFGDSGKWGKYAACDYYDTPLDIIGFKSELALIFQERFKQPKEEQEEIREWLPQEYKKLIK
ncbi:MAG: hypothetical protein LBR79_05420 [Oscillospiraceae bacterium]|jgi:hypothetical protein|nr:hypothetical protein [Oscillospiraceae bacterium]